MLSGLFLLLNFSIWLFFSAGYLKSQFLTRWIIYSVPLVKWGLLPKCAQDSKSNTVAVGTTAEPWAGLQFQAKSNRILYLSFFPWLESWILHFSELESHLKETNILKFHFQISPTLFKKFIVVNFFLNTLWFCMYIRILNVFFFLIPELSFISFERFVRYLFICQSEREQRERGSDSERQSCQPQGWEPPATAFQLQLSWKQESGVEAKLEPRSLQNDMQGPTARELLHQMSALLLRYLKLHYVKNNFEKN